MNGAMIVRMSKATMLFGLGLFVLLITFNNITDYGSNFEFVRHVMSMDTIFPTSTAKYRAITTPWLWYLVYIIIIAGEGMTAALLILGGYRLAENRYASAAKFQECKALAVAGITLGFLIWFVGFMAVGGEWFLMWQSGTWNGQEAAFRIYITMLAVLIFVMQPDREPNKQRS